MQRNAGGNRKSKCRIIATLPSTNPHRHPANGACRIPTLRPSVLRPNAAIPLPIATIWAKVRAKRGERSNINCRLWMLIRFRHFVPKILNHISILRIPKGGESRGVPVPSPKEGCASPRAENQGGCPSPPLRRAARPQGRRIKGGARPLP